MIEELMVRHRRGVHAAVLAALAVPALAAEIDAPADGTGGREESWQIEQRQQWFEQSRGLRAQHDAGRLRAAAVAELARQRRSSDPLRRASGESWQPLGPGSMQMTNWIMGRVAGRLNVVLPDPADDMTVYVGAAAGGVWKTSNGGASWTPLFDEVGTLPIGAIAIAPAAPQQLWVGTGDKNGGGCAGYFGQGVYLSEDGGQNWSARNGSGSGALPLSIVNAVALHPGDPDVVLAGGAGSCDGSGSLAGAGVWRSADRGQSWSRVLDRNVEDLLFVPGSGTVYAGLIGQGVFKSVDGGATWASASSGLTVSGSRLRLALAPSDSKVLYALLGNSLFRTADGGGRWTRVNSAACEGQCSYNQALAVHPTDPDTILVGSIRPARSTDGGATLVPLTSTWGTAQRVHQDIHVLRYSNADPQRLWVGGDGGLWRSDDAAASWVNMNSNLELTQFYDIAVHPVDVNVVFGGAQDNSSSGRRTSPVWNLTYASGDGFMNAFDQTNPAIVFQTSYPQGGLPAIVRSTEFGASGSFSGMPTAGLTSGGFQFLTPFASAGNRLFVASNALFRASTTGNSWTPIATGLGTVSVIVPEQQGSQVPVYVGTTAGRVHASADAAVAVPVFADVTGNYPGGRVADLAMDPGNPQRVFLARAGFGAARLYRSSTGGNSWTAVGNGLPNVPANSVVVDPLDTQRIFVGTDIGVYESVDGGDQFTPFAAGMPLGMVVTDLEISAVPHVLSAASYGRGAWRAVLAGSAGNAPPTADFSVASSGLDASFSDRSVDIDGSIASYSWNFGDGSAGSTAASPSHAYATHGRYTITLTVTDNGGLAGSYANVLRILAPAVTLQNGVSVTQLQVAQGEQLQYRLEVPANAVGLRFTVTGANGEDADLSVHLGDELLCESAGATSSEACDIPNAAPGTYVATVTAYSALSTFTLTGSYTVSDVVFANGFQ